MSPFSLLAPNTNMLGPQSTIGLLEVFAMLYFLGKKGSAKRPELCKFVDWFRTTLPRNPNDDADENAPRVGVSTLSRQLTYVTDIFGVRFSRSKVFGLSIVAWGFLNQEQFYAAMEKRVDLAAYDKFRAEN